MALAVTIRVTANIIPDKANLSSGALCVLFLFGRYGRFLAILFASQPGGHMADWPADGLASLPRHISVEASRRDAVRYGRLSRKN